MSDKQDNQNEDGAELEDLLGWLENDRTRDLVDMINRAAHGLPVQDAADRYKARYRHSGSVEKLSEMFDSLQLQQEESQASLELNAVQRQLDSCLAQLQAAQQAYQRVTEGAARLADEPAALQVMAQRLREIDDLSRELRERVIDDGSGSDQAADDELLLRFRRSGS